MNIIFEDESFLVIDKPANLVVDRSETQQTGTLEDWLDSRFLGNDILRNGIVHRLDKDTSGLIIVAKTQESLENLQSQFAGREVRKEYLALVHGLVKEGGVVEGPIGRNPGNREKFTVIEGGKEASTEYVPEKLFVISLQLLEKIFADYNNIQMRKLGRLGYGKFTLVRCFPKTGRTHQIRVHLKLVSHPIVSDEKYAGRKMVRLDKRWCPRQFLHASKISFRHPRTDVWMEFESKLPEDLEKSLKLLNG